MPCHAPCVRVWVSACVPTAMSPRVRSTHWSAAVCSWSSTSASQTVAQKPYAMLDAPEGC
eukprot:5602454-Amphidinium_carterae.1